ncbi:hypothetical protein KA016_00025 [Candidatus Saccharibacteria bacterium]|nr:hypothetical protein [Candidatus Saccharibacteria bacterium]
MSENTDPAKAIGYAFTHAPELDLHHLAAALRLSGVTAEHTGKDYEVRISVPTAERPVLNGNQTPKELDSALTAYIGTIGTLTMAVEMGSALHGATRLAKLKKKLQHLPSQNPELHARYQNLK